MKCKAFHSRIRFELIPPIEPELGAAKFECHTFDSKRGSRARNFTSAFAASSIGCGNTWQINWHALGCN